MTLRHPSFYYKRRRTYGLLMGILCFDTNEEGTYTLQELISAFSPFQAKTELVFLAYLSPTSRRKTFVLFRRDFRLGWRGESFRTYQFSRLSLRSFVYFPLRFGYTTLADLHTGRHDVSSVRPRSGVFDVAICVVNYTKFAAITALLSRQLVL